MGSSIKGRVVCMGTGGPESVAPVGEPVGSIAGPSSIQWPLLGLGFGLGHGGLALAAVAPELHPIKNGRSGNWRNQTSDLSVRVKQSVV